MCLRTLRLFLPGLLVFGLSGCTPRPGAPEAYFDRLDCFEDPTGIRAIDTLATENWRPCAKQGLDAGFSKSAFWFRASGPGTAQPAVLIFEWKALDQVDFFALKDGTVVRHMQAGVERPRSVWPLAVGDYMAEKNALAAENARILAGMESFGRRQNYAKTRLREIDVDGVLVRLHLLLEKEKLHFDENLSLAALAGRLNLSAHQLSELLNARLGLSFPRLLLNYRVQEAERRMRENPDESLLTIALESGFNSKTAFNVGFKKVRGMTPSAFRNGLGAG